MTTENDACDVELIADEGGAAHVIHDVAAKEYVRKQDAELRGRVVKGVPVIDLAMVKSGSVKLLAEVARDLEANGDQPCVKFTRDQSGQIDGVMICAALVLDEVA